MLDCQTLTMFANIKTRQNNMNASEARIKTARLLGVLTKGHSCYSPVSGTISVLDGFFKARNIDTDMYTIIA